MSATNIPNALLYIGGKAVQSSIRIEWRDIRNSAIQEVVAGVPFATKVKVDLVVANAKQTFRTCRNSSLAQRIMLKFQQLLCENTAPLAELITREHGKILPDAEGRAQQVVDGLILVGVRRHDAIDVAGRKARTDRLIGAGVEQGAQLLLDSRNCQVVGYPNGDFVGPTIFSGVTAEINIYTQEIFGPAMCVVELEMLDEAVAFINTNPKDNGTSICTLSGWSARKF